MEHPSRVGKYEIEQFLGGGMSRVYRAKDSVLGRTVAVKILTEAAAADAESKARFLQEARTASNIAHENIISVYDFGEEQGRPFMVMEFLEGESLRAAIKQGHAGDFRRRLRIALQIGRAIDHIHSKKIVHRDVKPENIHIDQSGKARLMDFGIAKAEGINLTRAGFTLGTPYYMAPEQVLGLPLTAQADVYSFGILLFELLAETRPITAPSVEKIFHLILNEPLDLTPLEKLDLPAAVIALIGRCTAKKAEDRPQGLGPVCQELERALRSWKPSAVGAAAASAGPPSRDTGQISEILAPTITTAVPVAKPPRPSVVARPAARPDGLPQFVENLPPFFRSQGGLMLLAGAAVLAIMTLLYWAATLIHIL